MSRETHIVGFQVGRETYGVPITSLHEIVRVPEITAVPDAPAYLEGVINLRGKIVTVVDLRKRFGHLATSLDRRSRILVVEHRGRLAGMIVDSASEVLKIPETDIEAAPGMMQEGGLDCVTGSEPSPKLNVYDPTASPASGSLDAEASSSVVIGAVPSVGDAMSLATGD